MAMRSSVHLTNPVAVHERGERHQPFLKATLALDLGTTSLGKASSVDHPDNLHYVLGNMGVPDDVLCSPLPPEGPRALLRYARRVAQG